MELNYNMHHKFKCWLTQQKYARFSISFKETLWMIYKVKTQLFGKEQILKYSWKDVKSRI